MSIQNYGTSASRNLIRAAQGMLEHAQPITVLGDFGTQREMPQNSTDTLVFRRTCLLAHPHLEQQLRTHLDMLVRQISQRATLFWLKA